MGLEILTTDAAQWSFAQHRSLFVLWNCVLSFYMIAHLCKSLVEDRLLGVGLRLSAMTILSWYSTWKLMRGHVTAARVALVSFVALNIIAYFAIGFGSFEASHVYEDSIPSRWMDVLLHLLFFAPILVIARLPLLGTCGLVLGTASGMVPYYMQTTGCALLPATMRALLVSGSSFLLYWWIMRKDAANYCAARDLAAHEAHLSGTGRKKAHTSGELRAQASSSGPFALGAARSPLHSLRPSRYHTHLRRVKIQVQLDIDVDPGSLPNITALLQMLAARLPSGWVADAAVRHGCVLVSLEVALPVQAANLPEGPAGNVSSSTLSSAGLLAELSDSVRSSAVDWASTVLSRMEPQTQELAPRLSLQMEDHKEVWVLDHHLREWCPGPDTAPLPQQGLFQLRVPRLALTWPHQAPQQYQQEGFQSRPASCPPAAAGAAFAAHPVRFEACLHAPWAAVQQGVHGWQDVPALDDPAWAAGQLVVLVRQAWGKYLPVQLEALHIVETVGSDAGPEAAAGTASATALAAKQHLRAACRFQVSVSIPTDALTEGGADRLWSLLHLELSVRENLLESCPIMLVPPQHADVAAELAAADAELGVLAFLHDLAEWLHLRGCMPGTACQPQLGSQDQAALMHAMGQDLLMSAQHWDMPALVCLLRAGLGNEEGWLVTRAGQQGTGQALPPRTAAAAAAAAVAAAATAAAGSLAPPGSSSTRVLSRAASAVTGAACISSRAADGDLAPWGPGGHPVAHVCARLQAGRQSRGRNREHAVAAKGELSIMQAEFWVGHLLTAMVVVVIAAAALHVVVT